MSREGWTRVAVRRTYLELRSLEELSPGRVPSEPVELILRRPIAPEEYLELYTLVGERWLWRDRLAWTVEELERYLADPDVHVWSAHVRGHTAGYFELKRGDPRRDVDDETQECLIPISHPRPKTAVATARRLRPDLPSRACRLRALPLCRIPR